MSEFQFTGVKAERYVIAVQTEPLHRKLLQIICTAKDGSLYVAFPYAQLGPGTIGIARIPAGLPGPKNLQVGHDFPATVHSVKYAHHPAGRAHFSLDGKVYTQVLREAVPLHEAQGHLFTVMVQGVDYFQVLDRQMRSSSARALVRLPVPKSGFEALKIIGRLYPESRLPAHSLEELPDQRGLAVRNPDGSVLPGVLLLTSLRAGDQRWLLLLTIEPIPRINKQGDAFLTFMGGFDRPEIALDHSVDTECLMFFYPYRGDMSEAIARAGTVDRPIAI
ncbi:MAG: hypothetical protein H0W40_17200 [Methylibium sp.]|uniref:hypothetical protein n=1 Tax=Methylibium sp. TaxID=2067992 RepID=UPI0017922492|nr:hypothetical protein [Methylibium sp.]MBA3599090.1 hypothetical protein [Methylibium sp.]